MASELFGNFSAECFSGRIQQFIHVPQMMYHHLVSVFLEIRGATFARGLRVPVHNVLMY